MKILICWLIGHKSDKIKIDFEPFYQQPWTCERCGYHFEGGMFYP